MIVEDTSICFVNCHLAAGLSHVKARNTNAKTVLQMASFSPKYDDFGLVYFLCALLVSNLFFFFFLLFFRFCFFLKWRGWIYDS